MYIKIYYIINFFVRLQTFNNHRHYKSKVFDTTLILDFPDAFVCCNVGVSEDLQIQRSHLYMHNKSYRILVSTYLC